MKTSNKILGHAFVLSEILNYAEELKQDTKFRIDDISNEISDLSRDGYWSSEKENELEQTQAKLLYVEDIIKTLEKGI